jgi:hypothetical protein
MKVLTTTAVLVFLATSLSAQGSAGKAKPAKAKLTPKEIKHQVKVKEQVLRFRNFDRVCVHLADRSQAEGQLMDVTNEGIQIGVWFPKCGDHTMPDSTQDHSSRFVPFGQIHSIKYSGSGETGAAIVYGIEVGLLGPLGWFAEWLLATGRAED